MSDAVPDPARRAEIEAVFDEALDLAPDRRGGWLAARCGDDEALRAEVQALLDALDRPEPLLDAGAAPFAALAGALAPELAGLHTIGPYRIIRELGRGGMGAVYLADRNDGQYRHRVAIKLLAARSPGAELERRFLAERQILATLSHPNVAQLLDGGITPGGLPYLVIEYVDGVPITTWCERESAGLETRLRLFRDVCAAVHHAHANLVLHLDVKPANILVTRDGQIKLLDFGIAKLMAARPGGDHPVTHSDVRPMTPAYASPEQLLGTALSTASDVYSLGLVLYELLAGVPPYDLATRSPAEAAMMVASGEPPRPSLRGSPFAGRLRGDLDAIVMMALRREPDRRYGSADLLSEDIGRYLDGQPVLAHRGSLGYRFGKLIRRNRAATAAIGIAVTALGGGMVTAIAQARVAERERARTNEALAESEEVANLLVRMFEPDTPGQARRDTVSVAELLRRGAIRAAELNNRPLVQARMFLALSRAHENLGNLAEAEAFAQKATEIQTRVLPADDLRLAASLARLARIDRVVGHYQSGDSLARRALAIRRAGLGPDHPDIADNLGLLSELAMFLGDPRRGAAYVEEAVAIRKRIPGMESQLVLDFNTLGSAYWRAGRIEAAIRALRDGEATARAASPPPSDMHAGASLRLAERLARLPEHRDEAVRLALTAVDEMRRLHGDSLLGTALVLSKAAEVLGPSAGARAEAMHREAVGILRRVRPTDAELGFALKGLAEHLASQPGTLAEAEAVGREAVAVLTAYYGPRHTAPADARLVLGDLLIQRGALDSAEANIREALAIREGIFGPGTAVVATSRLGLARLLTARGRLAEAESTYRASRAILAAAAGEQSPEVRRIDEALAVLQPKSRPNDVGTRRRAPQE